MRKITKICLIAGGICILVGGTITTAAAAMGATFGDANWHRYGSLGKEIAGEIRQGIHDEVRDSLRNVWNDDYHTFDYDYDDYDYDYDDYYDDRDDIYDDDLADDFGGDAWFQDNWFDDGASIDPDGAAARQTFAVDAIRKLDLEIREGRVYVKEDETVQEITILVNTEESGWMCYREEDELNIKVGPKRSDTEFGGAELYIQVPKGFRFSEMDVELKSIAQNTNLKNSGPFLRIDGLNTDEIDIDTRVGAVKLNGVNAGKMDVVCDVGVVSVSGSVAGDIDVECNVGSVSIELAGAKEAFNYEIKSKLGAVSVGDSQYSGLSRTEHIDNQAAKKMELECKTGVVEVKFLGEA